MINVPGTCTPSCTCVNELGLPLKEEKMERLGVVITLLGITLDTVRMELAAEDKVDELLAMLVLQTPALFAM